MKEATIENIEDNIPSKIKLVKNAFFVMTYFAADGLEIITKVKKFNLLRSKAQTKLNGKLKKNPNWCTN